MKLIPLSKLPAQTFDVILDGAIRPSSAASSANVCTLSLYWRQIRLYLDLSIPGRIIFQGNICQNRGRVNVSRSPYFKGTLHFFDLQGDEAPRWDGLNDRWVLLYVPEGEELPEGLRY